MKLVLWKGMAKGTGEDLPLRPFTTLAEAEAYVDGVTDLLYMGSEKPNVNWDKVRKDFVIIDETLMTPEDIENGEEAA